LDRSVKAIVDGVPGSHVKDKMGELETRKFELEVQLKSAAEESILLHPNMAQFYRNQVRQLRQALDDENCRKMLDEDRLPSGCPRIDLQPVQEFDRGCACAAAVKIARL
jgi:hypothetical protein